MDIAGTNPQPSLTLTPLPASTAAWTPGQILNAVVVSVLNGDRVTLRIGNTVIEAGSSGALSSGERLALQVMRSEDQLLLRALPDSGIRSTTGAVPNVPQALAGATLTLGTPEPATWRAGQTLQAVVTARNADRVSLEIGGASYEARASQPVAIGQRLTVQVTQTARPAVLQVVADIRGGELLQTTLRAVLPRQLPLQEVFAHIAAVAATSAAPLLRQLLQNLPDAAGITRGDSLKDALLHSGQFLERQLAEDGPATELRQDLKANLLRLLAALSQNPDDNGTLARQLDAAVARIQLHQLAAAAPEQSTPVWAGEIPLRNDEQVDVLRLRIDKDGGSGADSGQPGWSTWLSLDLKALGPLHARITLGADTLSTTFWAESDTTATLVNKHLDHLRQALQATGLEIQDLRCHRGRPPFLLGDRLPTGLLDITA